MVLFSEDFISDLSDIESIYRDLLFLPESGKKTISEIMDVCDSIGKFPEMGIDLESKFGYGKPYRYVIYRNYLLFYEIDHNDVMMLRLLDGRVDYMRVLFGNDHQDSSD